MRLKRLSTTVANLRQMELLELERLNARKAKASAAADALDAMDVAHSSELPAFPEAWLSCRIKLEVRLRELEGATDASRANALRLKTFARLLDGEASAIISGVEGQRMSDAALEFFALGASGFIPVSGKL